LGAPGLSPSHQEVNCLGHHAFGSFVVFHRTHHIDCHGTAWELVAWNALAWKPGPLPLWPHKGPYGDAVVSMIPKP
jgi:hypothetical protein